MRLKQKINEQNEYYKTTALFEALIIIKKILKNHTFVLMVAIALIVLVGILVGPFVYKSLNWNQIKEHTESTTNNADNINNADFIEHIFVTVSGEVKYPGMYEMTTDDRVNDAIEKAGGFTKNAYTENLNLAQKLSDEQYINVMSKDEIYSQNTETYNKSEFQGVVNINTGTVADLCQLPGIGESTARKIIEYRELTGGYEDIRDIQNVEGIGPSKFNKIKNHISI